MIYRDFKHWWQEGKHGFSAASMDYATEIWKDLTETIEASRDDYKNSFLTVTKEFIDRKAGILEAALEYIELYAKPEAPKFWRWYLEKERSKKKL